MNRCHLNKALGRMCIKCLACRVSTRRAILTLLLKLLHKSVTRNNRESKKKPNLHTVVQWRYINRSELIVKQSNLINNQYTAELQCGTLFSFPRNYCTDFYSACVNTGGHTTKKPPLKTPNKTKRKPHYWSYILLHTVGWKLFKINHYFV